jgi:exopolysaccharide biosynthesis polyprenyl glycosylphosphotransferase
MTSLFGHSVRSDVLALYVADALLCSVAFYVLLSWQVGLPFAQGCLLAVAIAAFCGVISGASGLYQPEAFNRTRKLVAAVTVAGLLLLVLLPVLGMMSPAAGASLDDHLFAVTLAFVSAVITTRLAFALALRTGLLAQEVAVLRCPERTADEAGKLRAAAEQGGGFRIAFEFPPGSPEELARATSQLRARRIRAVIASDPEAVPDSIRRSLSQSGVELVRETDFLQHQLSRVDIDRLPEGWLSQSNAMREGLLEAGLRRSLDILLGAALVLATLPLLLITALAIKLDTPGPVFYRQERVGRGGRIFTLFKFRSMVTDAEAAGAPVWASRQDCRVTRVGRFIRLTRIDEIPQVLNVLLGDMAFVGPRPERAAFVEKLGLGIPHYHDRAVVKPGITGWAQVNHPYGASVEDARMKLAYDLYYVQRRSLFLDLLILVATVRVVLFQEGSR